MLIWLFGTIAFTLTSCDFLLLRILLTKYAPVDKGASAGGAWFPLIANVPDPMAARGLPWLSRDYASAIFWSNSWLSR